MNEFPGQNWQQWEEWYSLSHSNAVAQAAQKISDMVRNLKNAIEQIDAELIRKWVYDLIIVKTFLGMRFQEAILKKISEIYHVTYRSGTPTDEAQGIDGYINGKPVSIKPISYQTKQGMSEQIDVPIIFYSKDKNNVKVEFDEKLISEIPLGMS